MTEGSLVECLNSFNYWELSPWEEYKKRTGYDENYGPKYKELSIVDGIKMEEGIKYISLLEYPKLDVLGDREWYDARAFRELQPPMTIEIDYFLSKTQTV